MKIALAECKQEVSTFNPAPSNYDDFRIVLGPEMISYHRGVREEVGGAMSVFDREPDLELVAGMGASSITSGGILAKDSFERLAAEFLQQLEAMPAVDGVYFCMHGAMQADGEHDPEGFLLEQARRLLGEEIPIVVSLDLHGILTDRMLRHATAVVPYHTYPHVDFFETGQRAARLLLNVLKRGCRPVTARVKIPALVRGDELITDSGAIRDCIQLAKEIERSPKGLAAGVMWGNPFTDVPELRTNALVVTDGDEENAIGQATELAKRFWRDHKKMQVPLTSLEESVQQAATVESGTVVMMDAADATSSGASGDSNAIVAEMVRQGYGGTVLAPVVDPEAVKVAFAAGVGADVAVQLGGALDPARFTPLNVQARVRMLSDGKFRSESFGWHWDSGNTAVLQADNVTWIVGTRPVSLFDRSWFLAHGQDPCRFDAVIVKSPHCEPQMFADWCAKLINVDAPGSTSANLLSLGHTNCQRPIFPLDRGVEFLMETDVFCR